MAPYRARSRGFSPRRRSFRRGTRLHHPTEPKRWEVGNVVIAQNQVVTAAAPAFTTVVSLAQLFDHFGDSDTQQGRTLNDAARAMEVGGMVFSYSIRPTLINGNVLPDNNIFSNFVENRVLLVSDRLTAAGTPNSIPNWFIAGNPIVAVDLTTPVIASEDVNYPVRIHWQDYRCFGLSYLQDLGVASNDSPFYQLVENTRGRANIRLRLSLKDTQGLFFHWATRVSNPAAGANITVQFNCVGTIYYRVRF